MGLMDGKRGLVVGIANDHSYAYYIAKILLEYGLLAHVFAEQPREVAVGPGVRARVVKGGSGAIEAASESNEIHGSAICFFTLSSDMRKYTACTRLPSSTTRSMAVSWADVPRSADTSASVRPM